MRSKHLDSGRMPRPSKPSLLDELREKSEAVRALDAAARLPLEQARQDISRALWQTYRWLDEAVGHLGVIRPTVARRFRLTDSVAVEEPRFDHGFVAFRREGQDDPEALDHVELHYQLAGSEPAVVRVGINAATSMDARLRASMLNFDYQTERDEQDVVRFGVFHVEPSIRASVRFQPDYRLQVVDVTLRNVDRLESLTLEFRPDAIGEPALEALVRCMLGESDEFLHSAPVALGRPRHAESRPPPPL